MVLSRIFQITTGNYFKAGPPQEISLHNVSNTTQPRTRIPLPLIRRSHLGVLPAIGRRFDTGKPGLPCGVGQKFQVIL